MLLTEHPGPWHLYVKKSSNVNLNIMVVRSNYLQEQLDYENSLSQIAHMQRMQPKGRLVENSLNDFVQTDYVEEYFI